MKHASFVKRFFFATSLILTLLFSTGVFLNSSAVIASATKQSHQDEKNYIEHEVVAKISSDAEANLIAAKYNLEVELLKSAADGNLYILTSPDGFTTKKLASLLKKNPNILSVQPNFKYKQLSRLPNDKYFPREWPLADTASTPGGVSAPSAWDLETKTKNKIPIAIIDTGVSYNQPDLKSVLTGGRAKGKNINNPKKKPADADGHGTFLAGIIAAQTNNKKGIAGASFAGNLKIMPLKFDFTTDQAISALNYAKARHIPIVNASWGAYGDEGLDLVLKDTIASFAGVFVTAAGNGDPDTYIGYDHDGIDPNQKMYPCDFDLPNIICVGASGKDGGLTEYSDYGANSVDVVAPGGTDNDPIVGLNVKKNRITEAEGSSLSTAFVTAEAGLILAKNQNLSAARIIEIIKNSVDLEPSLAGKTVTGGKINFQKALEMAANY
ncbi:MAG TPA: S8 family serine peptidase [Candidatus Bathyarchaeia archaeon]|nr:S8 family serine peptidase [Candidatus Bathyarchaeia archaeon]